MAVLRDPDEEERDDRGKTNPASVPDDERDPFDETPELLEDGWINYEEPDEPEDPPDETLNTGEEECQES